MTDRTVAESEGAGAAVAVATAAAAAAAVEVAPAAAAGGNDTNKKAKRSADRQISKDDGEDNDDDDGDGTGGTFAVASQDVLKGRKIFKAARTVTGELDPSATRAKKKANPFAGVNLVGGGTSASAPAGTTASNGFGTTTTTTTAVAAAPKVFGSTTGFAGFSAVPSGPGFGTSTAAGVGSTGTGGTDGKGGFVFGSGAASTAFGGTPSNGASSAGGFGAFATSISSSLDKAGTRAASNGGDDTADDQQHQVNPAMADDYQVTSGEEDEKVLFEKRCRTHRWGTVPTATHDADQHMKEEKVLSVPPSASYTMLQQNNASSSGDDVVATATETTATDTAKDTGAANGHENGDTSTKEDASTTDTTKAATTSDSPEAASSSTAAAAAAATAVVVGTWHEVGIGPLRVLRNATTHTCRLVQRRETTPNGPATKVLINLTLWKESTVKQPSDKHVQFMTLNTSSTATTGTATDSSTYGEAVAESLTETILFKFKLAEEASDLATVLQQQLAQAKSMLGGEDTATDAATATSKASADDADKKAE